MSQNITAPEGKGEKESGAKFCFSFFSSRRRHRRSYGDWSSDVCSSDLWNTVELVCVGEDAIHIVNGKVVMRLACPRRIDRARPEPITSGQLILQSEGAEVFYRAIEIDRKSVV